MSLESRKKALEGLCTRLNEKEKIDLALELAKLTLQIWEAYKKKNTLLLFDRTVSNTPDVEPGLLRETINAIEHDDFADIKRSFSQFKQPIVMLQDGDWELSSTVRTTFYSVYNLAKGILSNESRPQRTACTRNSILQSNEVIFNAGLLGDNEWNEFLENY
jgi:hypothetical protein